MWERTDSTVHIGLEFRPPPASMETPHPDTAMSFEISVNRSLGFVELSIFGEATMKNFVELVETVEQESVYWSDRKVLVDLRQVQGQLEPEEQVFLGELVAQSLPHLERMASVVPLEQITRNSEASARRMGLQLSVFASRDGAVAWLTAA